MKELDNDHSSNSNVTQIVEKKEKVQAYEEKSDYHYSLPLEAEVYWAPVH